MLRLTAHEPNREFEADIRSQFAALIGRSDWQPLTAAESHG
ncbi:MAG TPA: hypothetical protein VGI70_14655 [Polyangiales bacterium]|jgi:hypothetical protein